MVLPAIEQDPSHPGRPSGPAYLGNNANEIFPVGGWSSGTREASDRDVSLASGLWVFFTPGLFITSDLP
jgi:hypothetical protein